MSGGRSRAGRKEFPAVGNRRCALLVYRNYRIINGCSYALYSETFLSYIGACESGADFRSLLGRDISPPYILLSTTKNRGLIIFIDEPSVLSAIPVNPKWSCIVSRSAIKSKLGHSSVRFLRIRCNHRLSNIESHSLVWCSTFH